MIDNSEPPSRNSSDDGDVISILPLQTEIRTETLPLTARGCAPPRSRRAAFVNNMLDLAPYGRQEEWEDSPPGWPQHPTYG